MYQIKWLFVLLYKWIQMDYCRMCSIELLSRFTELWFFFWVWGSRPEKSPTFEKLVLWAKGRMFCCFLKLWWSCCVSKWVIPVICLFKTWIDESKLEKKTQNESHFSLSCFFFCRTCQVAQSVSKGPGEQHFDRVLFGQAAIVVVPFHKRPKNSQQSIARRLAWAEVRRMSVICKPCRLQKFKNH